MIDDIKKYYAFRSLIKRFIVPVLVVFMVQSGLTIEQIAIIGVVTGVIGFVLEIPSGAVADTLGHKRTLILSMLGQALAMGLYLGGSFWWILAASVMYWGAGTLMTGTMQALFFERLQELGREKEHQKLSGRARSISQAFSIIAMILSGLAYAWHWWLPFIVGVAQFLLAGLIISFFHQAKKQTSVARFEPKAILSHIKLGFAEVRKSSKLFWLTIFNSLILGLVFGSAEFHQVLLENSGLAVAMFGAVYAVKRIVGVVVPPFVHRITNKLSVPLFCGASGIFVSAILILVLAVGSPWAMAALLGISSAPYIALTVAGNDFKNQLIKSSSRATILSISNLVQQIFSLTFIGSIGLAIAFAELPLLYAAWGIALALIIGILMPPFIRAYRTA
ncbi:MFS transporter [Candidatus Uhrbacteria bacterium]|jgi:MFS family permease|nr:MFS transporter [Candidatus Uhrbacteria bacterium]